MNELPRPRRVSDGATEKGHSPVQPIHYLLYLSWRLTESKTGEQARNGGHSETWPGLFFSIRIQGALFSEGGGEE